MQLLLKKAFFILLQVLSIFKRRKLKHRERKQVTEKGKIL